MDYGKLQFSLKDVRDNLGKPMIRLNRFEWTCIGKNNSSKVCSYYGRLYFANKSKHYDQRADKLLSTF